MNFNDRPRSLTHDELVDCSKKVLEYINNELGVNNNILINTILGEAKNIISIKDILKLIKIKPKEN